MFVTLEGRSRGSGRVTDKQTHTGIQDTIEQLALQMKRDPFILERESKRKGNGLSVCNCKE